MLFVSETADQTQTQTAAHLKRVLCHARQAVVRHAGGDGANAEFTDLICLTELRDAFGLHHTHQAYVGERQKENTETERERGRGHSVKTLKCFLK